MARLPEEEPGTTAETDDGASTWGFDAHPDIRHTKLAPHATYAPWITDAAFTSLWSRLSPHSLLDEMRAHELWTLGKQATAIPGDILEVGTWRGGSAALLAAAVEGSGKEVYAADTFEGVVKAGDKDPYYKGGEHADAAVADVQATFRLAGATEPTILQGVFPDATGMLVSGTLSLVHVDVDVYQSARDVTEWALPRLSVGGVIVFDDYGFYGCEGVTRVGNELARDGRFLWVHNLNGHGIAIRITGE